MAKQKKTSAAEYKPVRNGGSGRPKKQSKLSVCSINPQNFSVRYGSHAVCVLMMSDTRLNIEMHTCPINPIYLADVLYFFGLCPIKICQCSGMTVSQHSYWLGRSSNLC